MMKIARLRLTHIRGFGDFTIKFDNKTMHTVLIGKNGTCKTTILRALAIGLADSKDASGLLAEQNGVLVAEDQKTATIEIDLINGDESTTTTTQIGVDNGQDVLLHKRPEHETPGGLLVCGYGIARQTEGGAPVRPYRIVDSAYTMFAYDAALTGTELTLRRLRDFLGERRFERTLRGIKRALGLKTTDRISLPKGGGVVISGPSIGKKIPIEGWADGYRKTLSWILDLYAWAMRADGVTQSGGVRGVLLVDEIEQHLHTSMQTTLLSRLRGLFPELQIIATTHSPLVALGAQPRSIVVLKRRGQRVLRELSVPDFSMYSVEDMISDPEIFDSEVYRPATNRMLARYRQLSAKPSRTQSSAKRRELKKLVQKLSDQQIPEVHENPTIKKLNQLLKKHNL